MGTSPYYLMGLGAVESVLNHALVPYKSKAVYLRLVDTKAEVLNYAANGFHVCVTRGLAGGCKDGAVNVKGTGPSSCSQPLGRTDLKEAWGAAAEAYLGAYQAALGGVSHVQIVPMLAQANAVADAAYAKEGVDPPRDPVTGAAEPPQAASGGFNIMGMGLAAGILGLMLFGGKLSKGKKTKKRAKGRRRKTKARRRSRPRRIRARRLRRRR